MGLFNIMEKETYIAPQMEVIEIENASMLAASAENIPVVDGEGTEILSNRHRGTWGNLWADDEKK